MIGIDQMEEVSVRSLVAEGVLSDSRANLCMANMEAHLVNLVRCNDITPVAVGLALKSGDTPVMYGCMEMARDDDTTHLQPFNKATNPLDPNHGGKRAKGNITRIHLILV